MYVSECNQILMIVDINCNELQPHALTIILWCALWCNIPLLLQIEMIKMYNLKMNLSIVCWHVPDWFTSAVLDDSSKQQTFSMDPAASRQFKLDSVSKKKLLMIIFVRIGIY